jgi:glycosyltransferase involved in cell wall biosynthesis
MFPTRPVISVCIPAFNASATLAETLASVWEQSLGDFEVIVVDDGSTDGTVEVLRRQRDPRLRVHMQGRNLGAAVTTNHAISLARGRYIKFLDSDDLLEPHCLRRLHHVLAQNPKAVMAFCRRKAFLDEPDDELGREWIRLFSDPHLRFRRLSATNSGPDLIRQWLEGGATGNWIGEPACVMATRAGVLAAGGQDPRIKAAHELGLWLRLMAYGEAVFVDAELARYRVRPGSHTRTNLEGDRMWLDSAWVVADLWNTPRLRATQPVLRAARTKTYRFVLKELYRRRLEPGHSDRRRQVRALSRALLW